MKVFRPICAFMLAIFAATGCGDDNDVLDKQASSIETYIQRNHEEYDEVVIGGVYRVVENSDRDDYNSETVIEKGDIVEYYFEGYVFTSSLSMVRWEFVTGEDGGDEGDGDGEEGGDGDEGDDQVNVTVFTAPFYTNIDKIIEALTSDYDDGGLGLTPDAWPTAPVRAKVGGGTMLDGLRRGLVGARENDRVLVFFTSKYGYGDKIMPGIPKDSPLAYRIHINKVEKQ